MLGGVPAPVVWMIEQFCETAVRGVTIIGAPFGDNTFPLFHHRLLTSRAHDVLEEEIIRRHQQNMRDRIRPDEKCQT